MTAIAYDGSAIAMTTSQGGGGGGTPGGSSGQIQYNNMGSFAGTTMSGDGTFNAFTGILTVTKTNGVAFAPSATTDTTNASNITSGTLSVNRFNSGSGASSTTFLRGDGTWAVPPGSGAVTSVSNSDGTLVISPTTGNVIASLAALVSGNILIGNASNIASSVAVSGDGTLSNSGVLIVTKTNGTSFAASATTNTTNANNISSGTLAVARGGTGTSTLTANAVVLGNGTSAVGFATIGTAGRVLIDQGVSTNPAFEIISGDGTLSSAGALLVTKTNGVAFASSATIDTTNATNISSGTLSASRLPNPSSTTLGGVQSYVAVTNQWINAISTAGVPSSSQPGFSNLSGTLSLSQIATGSSNTLIGYNNSGIGSIVSIGSGLLLTGGTLTATNTASGTVTSVSYTGDGTLFNSVVSGSPITTSGTFAPALLTQTANKIFAGPTTGSAASPTFRFLIGADLPNPSATTLGGVQSYAAITNQWINSISTSGIPTSSQPAFSNISGTAQASQGGTAQSSYTTGDILYASATNTLSKLAIGTTNYVLTVVSGVPAWAPATGGGGSPGGSSGQVQYNNSGSFGGATGLTFSAGAITNMDGVVIGATTPEIATFSTLNATEINVNNSFFVSGSSLFQSNAGAYTFGTGFDGSIYVGSNSYPLVQIQPYGINSPTWSSNGTFLGINSASGFTGNFIDFHINGGSSLFAVQSNGAIASAATTTNLSGTTSGTITYSMPFTGASFKEFYGYAAAYENNTATNQTITFPTAFTHTPSITTNSTGLTLSVSTTTLTITAPNNTTTYTGNIIIAGA